MAKPLDKMTKAELIALLQHVQTLATKFDAQLVQRTADVRRLQAQLDALESRRQFENMAHRAKQRGHHLTDCRVPHDKHVPCRNCDHDEPRAVSPRRAAMEAARKLAMETGKCVPVQVGCEI